MFSGFDFEQDGGETTYKFGPLIYNLLQFKNDVT